MTPEQLAKFKWAVRDRMHADAAYPSGVSYEDVVAHIDALTRRANVCEERMRIAETRWGDEKRRRIAAEE